MQFTSQLKKYRQEKKWTQEELAQKVGVRRETIIRLEQAKYRPSLELAMKLAWILEVSVYDLFSFDFNEQ